MAFLYALMFEAGDVQSRIESLLQQPVEGEASDSDRAGMEFAYFVLKQHVTCLRVKLCRYLQTLQWMPRTPLATKSLPGHELKVLSFSYARTHG